MSETFNHTEQSSERLTERISQLAEINKEWQCSERRGQIEREMTIVAFELSERFRETKGQEIEEAWRGRAEVMARLNEV